ncbi:hypothetical protein ACSS6W_001505 [Trichoderma asperelloides]
MLTVFDPAEDLTLRDGATSKNTRSILAGAQKTRQNMPDCVSIVEFPVNNTIVKITRLHVL